MTLARAVLASLLRRAMHAMPATVDHRPNPQSNPMEGLSLLLKIWWGLALLWPVHPLPITPGVLDFSPAHRDWVWGGLLLGLAAVHLAGIATGTTALRRGAMLLAVGVWIVVTGRYASAGWVFESGVFAIIAVCTVWAYWRLGWRT